MKINNLGTENSLVQTIMKDLRQIQTQDNKYVFRKNIERMGEIMAYEISKTLHYSPTEVKTPLGQCTIPEITDNIVIASIMRAGLPLHNGILNYFHWVENAFISAYRKHSSETAFSIKIEYLSAPSLNGKVLILADPMLATGLSLVGVYRQLMQYGKPAYTHLVSVISAQQGIDYCLKELANGPATLWTAATDPSLNDKGYIVPGLGDAGDLAFGEKI